MTVAAVAAPLPPPRPRTDVPAVSDAPASPARPGPAEPPATRPASEPARPDPAPPPAAPAAADPQACLAELAGRGAVAEPAPQPAPGNAACQVESPVRLLSVSVPSEGGRPLSLPDRPVIACRLAAEFAAWAGTVAAPVLKAARGSAMTAVRTGPGFECRSRNRQPGGKPSAHGNGLALDVAGFEFQDGRSLPMGADAGPTGDPALRAIRRAACGWFTTILGPGSDAFHGDHMHLDIQLHGSSDRYRICQ